MALARRDFNLPLSGRVGEDTQLFSLAWQIERATPRASRPTTFHRRRLQVNLQMQAAMGARPSGLRWVSTRMPRGGQPLRMRVSNARAKSARISS